MTTPSPPAASPPPTTTPSTAPASTAPAETTTLNRATRRAGWRPTGTEILTAALLLSGVELALILWLGMWWAALVNVGLIVVGGVAWHYLRRRNRHSASGRGLRSWTNRSPGRSLSTGSGSGTRTSTAGGLRRMLGLKAKPGDGTATGPLAKWRRKKGRGAGSAGTDASLGTRGGAAPGRRKGGSSASGTTSGGGKNGRRGKGADDRTGFLSAFMEGFRAETWNGKDDEPVPTAPGDTVRGGQDTQPTELAPVLPPITRPTATEPQNNHGGKMSDTDNANTQSNSYPLLGASEQFRAAGTSYSRQSLQAFGDDLRHLPEVMKNLATGLAAIHRLSEDEFRALDPSLREGIGELSRAVNSLVPVAAALHPAYKAFQSVDDGRVNAPRGGSLAAEAKADVHTWRQDS